MTEAQAPRVPAGRQKLTRLASWNACGLSTVSKQLELEDCLLANGVIVCAIQESHQSGSMAQHFRHYRWLGKPRRCQGTRPAGGVGFLVHNSIVGDVCAFNGSGAQEVLWLRVDGSSGEAPPLLLASVYMPCNPTSRAAQDACDTAFDLLQAEVVRYQQEGPVVLLGDVNGRVGRAQEPNARIGQYGEDHVNDNGRRLANLLEQTDSYALNGRRLEPTGGPMFTRSNSALAQHSVINYVLVDSRTYSRMPAVWLLAADIHRSDHRMLLADVPFEARPLRHQRVPKRRVWRLAKLRHEPDVQVRFSEAVGAGLGPFLASLCAAEAAADQSAPPPVEADQLLLNGLITCAAETSIGRIVLDPMRCARWWDRSIREAVATRCRLMRVMRITGTPDAVSAWRAAGRALAKLKKDKLRAHKQASMRKINAIAKDPAQAKQLWRAIDWRRPQMVQAPRQATPTVRNQAGALVCDERRVCAVFREHFATLGSSQPSANTGFDEAWRGEVEAEVASFVARAETESGPLDDPITEAEVATAVASTKLHKAGVRGDPLVNEFLKYGGAPVCTALAALFNLAFKSAKVPEQWRAGEIIALPKKGDHTRPENHRGITIMSHVGKVYTKVLDARVMSFLEDRGLLHESQCGFRPRRSCVDHSFAISQTIQGRLRQGETTYGFFIDSAKAYDTVWRDGLFYKAWRMGISGNIWRVIRGLMAQTKLRVRIGSTLSSPFTRDRGIDQGCNLSTTLYMVFNNDLPGDIARAMVTRGTVPVHPQFHQALYADDYAGLAGDLESCQGMADAARAHSLRWRWEANLGQDKTAIVVFRPRQGGRGAAEPATSAEPVVLWGDVPVNVQATYKHLGLILRADGSWDDHLSDLVRRATSRVGQLAKFLLSRTLANSIKRLLVMTCLLPMFEYGSAVWHASPAQAGLLTSQYLRALKMILRCPVNTPTEAVLVDLGLPTLEERWDLNKLRLEHMLQQLPAERDPKAVFDTCWGGRGAYMWRDKVRLLWQQLIPSAAERAQRQAEFRQLPKSQFDLTARALVSAREYAGMRRRVRAKKKLGLYAAIEQLEHPGGVGFPVPRVPRAYLRGCLTPLVQFKFKLRAGVAELRQELERRARGSRGKRPQDACCPHCPGVVETVSHFVAECYWHGEYRRRLWESLHGVNPTAAATLLGLPAERQAACLLSVVVNSSVDSDTAVALRREADQFLERLRGRLKGRLRPTVVSDARIAALFAESGSE